MMLYNGMPAFIIAYNLFLPQDIAAIVLVLLPSLLPLHVSNTAREQGKLKMHRHTPGTVTTQKLEKKRQKPSISKGCETFADLLKILEIFTVSIKCRYEPNIDYIGRRCMTSVLKQNKKRWITLSRGGGILFAFMVNDHF